MGLMTGSAFAAPAGELDNERAITSEQVQLAQALPASVVIRVNEATKAVEVLHSNAKFGTDQATQAAVASAQFTKMDVKGSMVGELDRDSSRSSWYFCFPNYNYYYPTYYYYGYSYSYSSYWSYSYGGYHYSYYSWNYGWGRGW